MTAKERKRAHALLAELSALVNLDERKQAGRGSVGGNVFARSAEHMAQMRASRAAKLRTTKLAKLRAELQQLEGAPA